MLKRGRKILWDFRNREGLTLTWETLFLGGLQNHCWWWLQPRNSKMLTPWKESEQPRRHIKKQRHYFANKGPSSQSYGFLRSHVWMWELDYKESWEPKNLSFWTVMLEKTLESPLDCTLCDPVDCSLLDSSVPWDFSRQEYWSRFPFSSPGFLPDPGIEPKSPAAEPPGKPFMLT